MIPFEHSKVSGSSPRSWLWALAPMLLAAALTAPLLGRDLFDVDEAVTLTGACAHHLGPCTPAEAIQKMASFSPDQPWGLPVVFSQWGQLVGWSEFAIRALPWLVGMLTIAWIYRLGREMFSPGIALAAALLLSTSVLFLIYMQNARFYGPAMLFTTIALWGYWRLTLAAKPQLRSASVALLAGATGVLYSQYFGALLIPTLGLIHLFLAPGGRRWRLSFGLLAIAVLLALPQVPDLLGGIAHLQRKESLLAQAVRAPEILSLFLRYQSRDLLNVPVHLASLLLLALPVYLLLSRWKGRSQRPHFGPANFLVVTSVLLLLLIMVVNELAGVFTPNRVRYLATMWPAAVLLIGLALLHPSRALLRRPLGGALLVALALAGASDFLQGGPLVRTSWAWRDSGSDVTLPTMKRVMRELDESATETLAFVDSRLLGARRRTDAYVNAFNARSLGLYPETTSQTILGEAQGNHEIVLLLRSAMEADFNLQDHVDFFMQRLWLRHRTWRENGLTFIRFVTPFSTLLIDRNQLEYDRGITLVGSGILHEPGKLRFLAHLRSADENLLADYSLAVHVIDPQTGSRVAQGDVGVGPGGYLRVVSDIDVSALPPGDYELHVALYDWQTGERLIARNLQTGAVSDMHVLQQFHFDEVRLTSARDGDL